MNDWENEWDEEEWNEWESMYSLLLLKADLNALEQIILHLTQQTNLRPHGGL